MELEGLEPSKDIPKAFGFVLDGAKSLVVNTAVGIKSLVTDPVGTAKAAYHGTIEGGKTVYNFTAAAGYTQAGFQEGLLGDDSPVTVNRFDGSYTVGDSELQARYESDAHGIGMAMGTGAVVTGTTAGVGRMLPRRKTPSPSSKWFDKNGNIIWPENDGFTGTPEKVTLGPGTRIDRYGYPGGSFVAPEGTPYGARSLAPGTESKPYNVYEVVEPLDALGGETAPWFGHPGGGTQYKFEKSIQELLDAEIIKEIN